MESHKQIIHDRTTIDDGMAEQRKDNMIERWKNAFGKPQNHATTESQNQERNPPTSDQWTNGTPE
eukprot:12402988-Karenia_brevis.AAC.1